LAANWSNCWSTVSGGLDPRDFGGATRFSGNAISADDRW
jgi:hypothetical protein